MLTSNSSSLKNNRDIKIKKSTLEWLVLICLIIFSFINSITLLLSLILLLFLLKQKEIGAIKIINIITFRTVINPGVAVVIDSWQNLKWVILFGCSIYLLFSYFKLNKNELMKINKIASLVILFTIYNIVIAFVFSSLPIVAIFKLFSYVIIFLGCLIGVAYTYKNFNWIKWLFNLYSLIFISSIIFLFLPLGYLRTGVSFQGITNQPNMFGILMVLYIALVFSYGQTNKNINRRFLFVLLALVFYMIILSASRTALISSLTLTLIYLFFIKINKLIKRVIISFFSICVILLPLNNNFNEFFVNYLYKGQEQGELLNSRVNQIEGLTSNFLNNPWFGNGFMVPVLPFRSFEFNSNYIVEPGNIILSILSFSGIFGFLIFIAYLIKIIWVNKSNFIFVVFLPIATILVSMGEMVFFSSNNIGIWCYMFLAIYMFWENEVESEI
ncbi:O-antigen ligase [Cytobacillus oceanisediminis]|uniref:O-antigen ligase family protein n=1 Tax=Cytobacillus oceanisediminis TaxID=665099 RepID=UPI00119F28B2|nr:O-antigen ligase family protein [Cytobacillus oceanisediminis]